MPLSAVAAGGGGVLAGAALGALLYRAMARRSAGAAASAAAAVFSPKPDRSWTSGAIPSAFQPVPDAEMVRVDPSALPPGKSAYALCISAVVPRPVAFVSSLSADGVANLAPFSFFGLMCHDPPTLVFCAVRRKSEPKDTLANVLHSKECVVHIIDERIVEAANACCGEYAPEVDEFELSGLSKAASSLPGGTPRVAEALVAMDCTVTKTEDLVGRSGEVTATMVFCRVDLFHLHPGVARKTASGSDYVDLSALSPISRLGGNDYGRTGGVFSMPRPAAVPVVPGANARA